MAIRRSCWDVLAVAVALALGAGALPSAAGAAEQAPSVVGTSTLPAGLERLPRLAPDRRMRIHFFLRGRNTAQLDELAQAISDPLSPRYGRYLTPAQARSRFAPARASVAAVREWAARARLRVKAVSRSRRIVELAGTAGRLEAAFRVRLRGRAVDGESLHLADGPPRLAPEISEHVAYVAGLTSEPRVRPAAPPPPASDQRPPCSRWWNEVFAGDGPLAYGRRHPWILCGYTPRQIQSAYGVADVIAAGLDGRGQSVGIVGVGSSPTVQEDVDTYALRHGLPPVDLTIREAPSGESQYGEAAAQAWYFEQALDIEAVHALAPAARIVYQAASLDRRTTISHAIDELIASGQVQIISLSIAQNREREDPVYDPPGRYELDEQMFRLAAVQGIGIYGASGDYGDGLNNPFDPEFPVREASWPSISQFVTGVGGTTLAIGPGGKRVFEIPWGNRRSWLVEGGAWHPGLPGEYTSGGGGGTSQIQGQPDYQEPVVPEPIAYYYRDHPDQSSYNPEMIPGRAVPDLAAVGDPSTGLTMGLTLRHPDGDDRYGELRVGGTSLSTPIVAGLMALADQAAGRRHGAVNPLLYSLAGGDAFNDIAPPGDRVAMLRNDFDSKTGRVETSIVTASQLGTLTSAPGYDDSTGLGTPNGVAFLKALAPGWVPPAQSERGPSTPPEGAPGPDGTPRDSCARKVRIRLPRLRRDRIVRAVVYAGKRKLRTRRGRALRTVTFRRRGDRSVRIRIVLRTARGERMQIRRRVPACAR